MEASEHNGVDSRGGRSVTLSLLAAVIALAAGVVAVVVAIVLVKGAL
jgi:hypothetical protein